jgi:hypothetical protein
VLSAPPQQNLYCGVRRAQSFFAAFAPKFAGKWFTYPKSKLAPHAPQLQSEFAYGTRIELIFIDLLEKLRQAGGSGQASRIIRR